MATAFTLALLKTELTTDPGGLGYVAARASGNVAALANLINLPHSGSAADGVSYSVFRNDVVAKEVANAITAADFAALTALQLAQLQFLFLGGVVDFGTANVRQSFQAIFSAASAGTKAAIVALANRQGSRAEALWGVGVAVTVDQVVGALNS